jgi:uncharacterized protein
MNLPCILLTCGEHRIRAHVARTDEDRAQGLMHCEKLADDEGMLFIHDEPVQTCFWMKNTPLPLAIAFIDDEGRIDHLDEMAAHSTESVCASAAVRFVLEVNAGWFAERGIEPGARIDGLPVMQAVGA